MMGMGSRGMAGGSPQPNPMVEAMASRGRKGDTEMAHVTPGEVVIPNDIIDASPELLSNIVKAFRKAGVDWRPFVVGTQNTNVNPQTGAQEFGLLDDEFKGVAPDPAPSPGPQPSDPNTGLQDTGGFPGTDTGGAPAPSPMPVDPNTGLPDPGTGGSFTPPNAQPVTQDDQSFLSTISNIYGTPFNLSYNPNGVPMVSAQAPFGGTFGESPLSDWARASAHGLLGREGEGPPDIPVTGQAPYVPPPATPDVASFTQPVAIDMPGVLASAGLAGLSPLQQRTAIATGGVASDNSIYRDKATRDYYINLLMRDLIGQGGALGDYGMITPVEHQYLAQVLGEYYNPTTESLLAAIASS